MRCNAMQRNFQSSFDWPYRHSMRPQPAAPTPHRRAPARRAPAGRSRRAGSAKQGQCDGGSQRPKREWGAEAPREDATPVAQEGEETGEMEVEEGFESVEQSVLGVVFFFFCFVFSFCRSFFGGYGEKEIREPR